MISLENVSKVYMRGNEEVRALDGVSLTVAPGEFVVLRGPSGCGKSTLLLTVGGMIRPTQGRASLDGEDLYGLSGRDRARLRAERIGFVFQMFHLVPYLSALDNVLVPTVAGMSQGRRDALDLLARLQLADRAAHRPMELSTGERQRVALARALLKRPSIILADEPTGNLDPANAAQVMGYLDEFHSDGGTVVVVSHDALAQQHADRTLQLVAGRLQPEAASRA